MPDYNSTAGTTINNVFRYNYFTNNSSTTLPDLNIIPNLMNSYPMYIRSDNGFIEWNWEMYEIKPKKRNHLPWFMKDNTRK